MQIVALLNIIKLKFLSSILCYSISVKIYFIFHFYSRIVSPYQAQTNVP